MSKTKIVMLAVVLTGVAACGKEKADEKTSPPPAKIEPVVKIKPEAQNEPPPEVRRQSKMWMHALSCPSRKDFSVDKKRVIERRQVTLERQVRQIVRKDCANNILSERPEDIKKPVAEIILTPRAWLGSFKGASVYIFNRTTCSGPRSEMTKTWQSLKFDRTSFDEQGKPVLRFLVNASPTEEQMHVAKHAENYIDYEFAGCAEEDLTADGSCSRAVSVEKGTLILRVNYGEQTLDQPQEVVECESRPEKVENLEPFGPPTPKSIPPARRTQKR